MYNIELRRWRMFILFLGSACLCICPGLYAQGQITVTGQVSDENNEPLPGTTVMVEDTEIGTTTDLNGIYTIEVEANAILVFSYIGYERQRISLEGRETLDVSMELATGMLDELIVVGYGEQSYRDVTGSISRVSMETTEGLPNTNVSQALRGRVAGVQVTDNGRPGQGGSLLVRGPRSLSASNSPLIVLDGIVFNGSLIDINPNDIVSIDVLKDASASAVYGSRAANGVILITSRRGDTDSPQIRINSFFGISDPSEKLPLLTPERYLERARDARTQMGISFDPNDVGSYLTITEAQNYRDGNIVNPYDEVFRQGQIYSMDMSVSGNISDVTNYYLSGSMSNETGMVYGDDLQRYSFRANIENTVSDWLTIGTHTMFSENDQSGIPINLTRAANQSPFGTWYREDGTPTQYTVPEDQVVSANPFRDSYLSDNLNIRTNLFANFFAIVEPQRIEGLSFRVNYSVNNRWIRDYNSTMQDPYLSTNIVEASKRNWRANDSVLENILTYQFQIADDHVFDTTLMFGYNRDFFETTTANSTELISDLFGWHNLGIGGQQTVTSNAQEVTGVSSMGRLNYRFKDRYLLTLTARRDGSSVFSEKNKYATLPSAAISWIVSGEDFMKNIDIVSFLRLRASYGAVGNQAISPYQSLSLSSTTRYIFGQSPGQSLVGVYPSSMSNIELKWETTYTTNLTLDFELFQGRIGGVIEVYNMDTKDLLIERSIPIMTGYQSVWTNLGQVNNKGIELTFNTSNIRTNRFEWSTDFVFSHNRNKIVSIYGPDADGIEHDDIGNRWFIGHPMNVYYDYVFDGIYQAGDEIPEGYQPGFARFKDLNGDGEITADHDRTIIGQSSQPKYRWGITNTFNYKDFQLSVFINAMQGWIATFNELNHTHQSMGVTRPVNRVDTGWWTEENKSNTRPSLSYSNAIGHSWYSSRNFIRIQDVYLRYSIPSAAISDFGISNMSFYVSAKNLATFTDWKGTNPESISTDRYPIARTFSVGLELAF